MLWHFAGPYAVYLLDLFCSGIQFYLLLSPLLYTFTYMFWEMMHWSVRSLSCNLNIYVSWSTSELSVRLRRETRLSPPVKYFTSHSKAVLLLWIFYLFFLSCLLLCIVRVSLLVPCENGLTFWLSFVVYYCEFATFPLASWVRCGTWLYRFLFFALLLTL